MRSAHDVAAVRAAEASLMATVPEGALMQRAAAGLARTCAGLLDQVYGARVVLLVGSGDNGGDALFAGARLARRGARVTAVLVSERSHPAGRAALAGAGGGVLAVADRVSDEALRAVDAADLILDGVLGIGGRGGLRGAAAGLAVRVAEAPGWRVAADLPSGVEADTGAVEGVAFTADVTVTFGTVKPGLLVHPGAERAGLVELVDIGLGPHLPPEPALRVLDADDVALAWPQPGPGDDKYTRGVVGVAAGSQRYTGAAVLATGAAVRSGAGLVRYTGGAEEQVRARWPEVVVGDGRVQAWVVGPGLGTDPAALDRLADVLAEDRPTVVDADALTLLAAHRELLAGRTEVTVLTPHDGEFARFGSAVGSDRVGAARRLAADLGVTVLLKGATTVVVEPGGAAHLNPTGTAALATGGTGDVLAGLVGRLLAGGLGPVAAVHGAFVHGLAGRLAAAGGRTVSAGDVLDALPDAVAAVVGPPRGRIAG